MVQKFMKVFFSALLRRKQCSHFQYLMCGDLRLANKLQVPFMIFPLFGNDGPSMVYAETLHMHFLASVSFMFI